MGITDSKPDDFITLDTVQRKYLKLCRRHLSRMCSLGIFETAFKPGTGGKTSKWLIARWEVIKHATNNHRNPYL